MLIMTKIYNNLVFLYMLSRVTSSVDAVIYLTCT